MAWEFNQDRFQQERDEAKQEGGSDFLTFEEGDTVVYVCEPCYPDDALNYVEVKQHRIGDALPTTCLNPTKNKVLEHPALVEALANRNDGDGLDISDGCPVCQDAAAGKLKDAKAGKVSGRFFWNMIPIKYRPSASAPWKAFSPADKVRPAPVSYTCWDGIMNQYGNEGNVSDRDKAIYLMITREGKTKTDTEYTVGLDTKTVREPVNLSEEQRAAIDEALQSGGSCDLYKIIASMIKSPEQIRDMLAGGDGKKKDDKGKVATAKSGGESNGASSTKGSAAAAIGKKKPAGAPACYAHDCAPADADCQKCDFKKGCAAACGVEVPVLTSVKPFVKPEKAPAKAPARIKASEAEEGVNYELDGGAVMEFAGTAKGKFFFQNEDGERKALTGDTLVTPVKAEKPAAAAKEEPKAKALTVADAKKDAWYTVGDDATARQFQGHQLIKGVKKGLFDDEEANRIVATLDTAIAAAEAPAANEETETQEEPPMPAQEETAETDDAALAELEQQLAARKKKAK